MVKPILVPSLKVSFEDEFLHDTVKIIVQESYADIFPILMQTLVNKPHLFVDQESMVNEKLSQTISGLESISGILENMRKDQGSMQEELTESIKIMQRMADEILLMKEQNSVQQKTLSETLDILSSSQDGLEILKQLNEKSNIDLEDVVLRSQARQAASNFGMVAESIKNDELNINTTEVFYPPVPDDEDDDEDLFGDSGFTDEERSRIINQFRQV